MTSKRKLSYISAQEYLDSEKLSRVKNEYIDGQVFAMTGATGRHRTIAGNIYRVLHQLLKGGKCRADISDAMVEVVHTSSYYYPDVVVSCGSYDDSSVIVEKPALIVEVMSRSTAAIDRREKLYAYKRIDSLKEYMIVHQLSQCVELHRRSNDGLWEMHEFTQGEVILESIQTSPVRLSLEDIYEDVDWKGKSSWEVREGDLSDPDLVQLDW